MMNKKIKRAMCGLAASLCLVVHHIVAMHHQGSIII